MSNVSRRGFFKRAARIGTGTAIGVAGGYTLSTLAANAMEPAAYLNERSNPDNKNQSDEALKKRIEKRSAELKPAGVGVMTFAGALLGAASNKNIANIGNAQSYMSAPNRKPNQITRRKAFKIAAGGVVGGALGYAGTTPMHHARAYVRKNNPEFEGLSHEEILQHLDEQEMLVPAPAMAIGTTVIGMAGAATLLLMNEEDIIQERLALNI